MNVASTIARARRHVRLARQNDCTVGLVPTMGALHAGHASLIETARENCVFLAVSIFVNPSQFGPNEDYENYPRPMEKDLELCRQLDVDMVFAPSANEMYPEKNLTWIQVEQLCENLCGASRPTHFRGVTTVCAKLFNIIQPDYAFFGQKDAQQSILIRKMVKDLNMPLEIVVCPTIREKDGLAISSRNKYLTPDQRKDAPLLYQSLQKAQQLIQSGQKDPDKIRREMEAVLKKSAQINIEYLEIVNPDTLEPLEILTGPALIAIAARLGQARLIDNIITNKP